MIQIIDTKGKIVKSFQCTSSDEVLRNYPIGYTIEEIK